MGRYVLGVLLAILLLPIASAETYRISGKATYADTTPVSLDYVYVECEIGAYECYQYRGTKAMTDAYGYFTVVIDAGSEEDGVDILLRGISASPWSVFILFSLLLLYQLKPPIRALG